MDALEEQSSRWRAAASPGGLIGLFFLFLSVVIGVAAYLSVTGRFSLPLSDVLLWAVLVLAAIAALLFLYLCWAYLSIGYHLDAESLQIRWGLRTERVPLLDVESIAPAEEILGPGRAGWKPLWPGYYVGRGQTDSGEVQVVATLPRRRQVLISVSDGRLYAISPERPLLFMEEFARWHDAQRRREAGAVSEPEPAVVEPAHRFVDAGWTGEYSAQEAASAPATEASQAAEQPAPADTRVYRSPPSSTSPLLRPILLRDPVALALIIAGILATAVMVGYILIQYDDIPPSLTLHWNAEGLPGRVGEPREIWILPIIAGLVLLANLGLAWSIALFDRFAARLMLGATVIAQIVTWIALLMLIG